MENKHLRKGLECRGLTAGWEPVTLCSKMKIISLRPTMCCRFGITTNRHVVRLKSEVNERDPSPVDSCMRPQVKSPALQHDTQTRQQQEGRSSFIMLVKSEEAARPRVATMSGLFRTGRLKLGGSGGTVSPSAVPVCWPKEKREGAAGKRRSRQGSVSWLSPSKRSRR